MSNILKERKRKTDWATDKAKKAKSTDAYLRMLAKTSEEKRKKLILELVFMI